MATPVFSSDIANTLKDTLNELPNDYHYEVPDIMSKWCRVKTMSDAFEDDLEFAGPGLASEKPEGTEIVAGSIKEGVLTRYWARTFALKLLITEEAIEDGKYKEVTNAAVMLKRSGKMTVQYDSSLMLARGFNTAYTGGDGLPLWSASHTLPHGGTWSNLMATPMSPSPAAVQVATTQVFNFPGHDGLQGTFFPTKVVYPNAQWAIWAALLKSEKTPDMGNFAEINVIKSELDITPVRNPFWQNTTTNWTMLTNCMDGLQWKWRVKAKGRSWVDNNNTVMLFAERYRASRGWSDPRGSLGVNA